MRRYGLPPIESSALSRGLSRDWEAVLFVGLVWLAQAYLLFDFISIIGTNIPFYDEWEMVPTLTGAQSITWQWLWAQHNEHRIPLPRLVYLLVHTIGGLDFRSGMYFDAGLLSLMAAVCCWAVRRLRGYTAYADAFFPLLLLHWGQAQNLSWSFQIVFVLSAALALIALLLLSTRRAMSWPVAFGIGLCAIGSPLTGGAGLALVPALGCCALLCAWELGRAEPGRWWAWLSVAATGLISFGLLAAYFVDYVRPARHPVSPSIEATLRGTLQFLTNAFGGGTAAYWLAGSGALTLALSFATAGVLLFYIFKPGVKRTRALRLLLFMGGMLCMALGTAWARVALNPIGLFDSRYSTLAAPFLCAAYLSWELLRNRRAAQFVQMALCIIMAVLVIRNREHGYGEAMRAHLHLEGILTEIRNGVPRAEIVRRHCRTLYYVCTGDVFSERLGMLRAKRSGAFAVLRD